MKYKRSRTAIASGILRRPILHAPLRSNAYTLFRILWRNQLCREHAKKALLREVGKASSDPRYAELEAEILQKINASGVGSQGLGGDITALAVHIEFHPCHLASLPVAVNLNCHAARHAEVIL